MSSHHLRNEKNCLNCDNTVEERYCGKCGQENIEPRQTFGHLIAHFFEDLTHYEGKFWGTLRYLFFKPALLTKEYLAGKRSKYVPPVRLYIFASFITFLLPALIPNAPSKEGDIGHNEPIKIIHDTATTDKHAGDSVLQMADKKIKDSVTHVKEKEDLNDDWAYSYSDGNGFAVGGIKTLQALDSAKHARVNTDNPMGYWKYKFNKSFIGLNMYPKEFVGEMLAGAFKHTTPKALFVYMPLFALILRLFHRKRKWIYFDHGIFTLHLFSFMLLAFLAMIIMATIVDWIGYLIHWEDMMGYLSMAIQMVTLAWMPYYLFRAHRKMYEETVFLSMAKVWGIIFINTILFIPLVITFAIFTIMTVH